MATEILNDALFYDRYEIIGGEKFIMAAAAPNITHGIIVSRLTTIFNYYIDEKNLNAFVLADNADVYLSAEDHFRPDVSVINRKPDISRKERFIAEAPDLIVEVLSESTAKNDFGRKKDAYEKYGVREYWIVNPKDRSIFVYHLIEGRFTLDNVYQIYSADELECLTERERSELTYNIKVSIFDDLIVDIRNVFKWWLDE